MKFRLQRFLKFLLEFIMEDTDEITSVHENGTNMEHGDTDEFFHPARVTNGSPVEVEHNKNRLLYETRTSTYRQNYWNSDEGTVTIQLHFHENLTKG